MIVDLCCPHYARRPLAHCSIDTRKTSSVWDTKPRVKVSSPEVGRSQWTADVVGGSSRRSSASTSRSVFSSGSSVTGTMSFQTCVDEDDETEERAVTTSSVTADDSEPPDTIFHQPSVIHLEFICVSPERIRGMFTLSYTSATSSLRHRTSRKSAYRAKEKQTKMN